MAVQSPALRSATPDDVIERAADALRANNVEVLVVENKKGYDKAKRSKRFWFPTDDTSGPGGMSFDTGLE